MQKIFDEGHASAPSTNASGPRGVVEDPGEVAFCGAGWAQCIGRFVGLRQTTGSLKLPEREPAAYLCLCADAFVFTPVSAILVMWGRPLSDFFAPDSYLRYPNGIWHSGPFFLLKGGLSKPEDPPTRLKRVVLVQAPPPPEGVSRQEYLGLLLKDVTISTS